MISQKRLLLSGMLLAVSLSFSHAQLFGPHPYYYIEAPAEICAGEEIQLCIRTANPDYPLPSPLPPISWWGLSSALFEHENCKWFYLPASYSGALTIHASIGSITIRPVTIIVRSCEESFEITSDAQALCAPEDSRPAPFDDFTLLMEDADATAGEQVCLDVTTQNFRDIAGLGFSINYNPQMLQFHSISHLADLPGFSIPGNFVLPTTGGAGMTAPGQIVAGWTDLDLSGESLPDGTTLFTLCFTALAGANSTQVVFSGTPSPIEVVNSNAQNVPFNSEPGEVRFGATAQPEPRLRIAHLTNVIPGQHICTNVSVQNFTNIRSLRFSIQYDTTQLRFLSVGSQLLEPSAWGLPQPQGTGTPGFITFEWVSSHAEGITFFDATSLFNLCFTILSGDCSSEIVFSNTPMAIEILNIEGQPLSYHTRSGRVTLEMGTSGTAPACCEKVCKGATVQYQVSEDISPTAPSWLVTGADRYTLNHNGYGVEVVWGNAGMGVVRATVGTSTLNRCVNILEVPEAEFHTSPPPDGETLRVCRGQTVSFANTTSDAAGFEWHFGDGNSSTMLHPTHTFAEAGIFRAALIVWNECYCPDTAFVTVIVSPTIAPTVTCRGTVCEGTAVTYTTDADCGTFLWDVSPNGTISAGGGPTDNFISIDWHSGPEGSIQLQVDNCTTADYCPEPNIMRVPIISEGAPISGPEQVCRGQSARYVITPFGGSSFTWSVSSLGDIQSGQGTNEINVVWAGQFSSQPQWVAVEYENCYLGCGGRDTIWVDIHPEFFVSGRIELCLNESGTYAARRVIFGNNVLCNWEAVAADGSVVWASSTAVATTLVAWNFGTGYFRLIARPASPNDYCIPAYEVTVHVLELPPALSGIAGASEVCPELPYAYQALGLLPGHTAAWSWSGISGSAPARGNPVNAVWSDTQPLSHSVQVRQVSASGCISPAIALPISALPELSLSGVGEACADERSLYATDALEQVEYNWSVSPAGAGTVYRVGNAHEIEIHWHTEGLAEVHLSVCGQNLSVPVLIRPKPEPHVNVPAFLCAGETITVQTTAPFASYIWKDAADHLVSDSARAVVTAGYYQVEVKNDFNCRSTALFDIRNRPVPEVSLSTPNNTGICPGDPPTILHTTESGITLTYAWFRNGNPIAGAVGSTYPTTETGLYFVKATDGAGCSAFSNTLTLFHYCDPISGGGGFPGGCPGGSCGNPGLNCPINTLINIGSQPSSSCNTFHYTNQSTNVIPGSLQWNFGDPGSGGNNISELENPTHSFSRAGYFGIYLAGIVETPAPVICYAVRVDTMPLAARFFYESACAGEPVLLTDASTFLPGQTIVAYHWNFGDPASGPANTDDSANTEHVFSSPGNFVVTLTVTAESGCVSTFADTVEVFGPPAMAFFDEPTTLCAATALPFDAQLSNDVVNFYWNFGDPASGNANASQALQPFHRYESPGLHSITLDAVNIYGCTRSFQRNITVEVNDLSGDIAFQSPICEGDSTLLSAPPGGAQWLWSNGEISESIWAHQSGVYKVNLTGATGCAYEPPPAAIQVNPAPRAPIRAIEYNEEGFPRTYTYDSLSVCVGENVFLEVGAQSGHTYRWFTDLPGPYIEFSDSRDNRLPEGEHDVWLSVTETATGCAYTEHFRVIVRPLPLMPATTASPSGPICEGTPVHFAVTNIQPGVMYDWSSGASGATWTTSRAGAWQVRAANEWGCVSTGSVHHILPSPAINLIPSGCHIRCRPDTLCFPPVPDIVSYQWMFNGNEQGPASASVPQIVITESGQYSMRMTTLQGCTSDSHPLTLDLFDGSGDLRGFVYWDRNNNGVLDPTDSLLSNIPFMLLSGNMSLDTILSQNDGQYSFVNMPQASYSIQLDAAALPDGLLPDLTRIDTILAGCDVEVLLYWRVICPQTASSVALQACPGSPVDYNGNMLPPGTTTDFTLTNVAGCDSIVTVTVTALPTSASSVALQACPGSPVDYNGAMLLSGTTTDFTLTNAAGCDSIVTVTVTALPTSASSVALQACPGSPVDYNGNMLPPGTTTDFTLTNAAGCDSIVTVTVTALPTSASSVVLQACPGSPVDYNGTMLLSGTTTDFTLTNAAGCDSIVTVTVTAYPSMLVQTMSEESCPGQPTGSISVSATGQGPFRYRINGGEWQNGAVFSDLRAGTFHLLTEDGNGCSAETRVVLEELAALQLVVPDAVLPCNGEPVMIEALVLSGHDQSMQLQWDDGSSSAQRMVTEPGAYRITAINGCDTLTQTLEVRYADTPDLAPVYIPNAFSPNDDGVNDYFRGYASDEVSVQNYDLMIFDRWGNLLFHTRRMEEGWDGQFRGRKMEPGVLVWHLRATVLHCGRLIQLKEKGDVTLIR